MRGRVRSSRSADYVYFRQTVQNREKLMAASNSIVQPAGAQPAGLTLEPLSSVAGVAITGVDLNQPLDVETRATIDQAFLTHHLIAFRGQSLGEDAQLAFTEQFGELEQHVIRLRDGRPAPLLHQITNLDALGDPTSKPFTNGNYFWHTDKSYHAVPSLATLLHAITLPPNGGDTEYANTYLGYAALPAARKKALATLNVVHSWEASRKNSGNPPATEDEKHDRPPVTHPLVRTHPDTGRKTLYLGIHTSHIDGMDYDEGRALLHELLEFTTQEAFVYTHQWQPGDLVMWDNRCLLHRACSNFDMDAHPRVLNRTVVRGTVPR